MKRFVRYAVTVAVCAAIAVAVMFIRGVLGADGVQDVMRILSDGFFVSGVVSLVSGSLIFAGNSGLLDAFFFTCRKIWIVLHNREYREKHTIDYTEYREKRRAKVRPTAYLFITGGAFASLGILFTVLFYCL